MTPYQYDNIDIDPNITLKDESKDFYNYLISLGMSNKALNRSLILHAKHGFYYDASEVKKYNTIINLKKLNNIKRLDDFLYSLYYSSKTNTNFCGCFIRNKRPNKISGNHKFRKYIRALTLLIDSSMARLLSEKDVRALLNAYQFDLIHIKEIRGITYFYSKKR